MMVVFISVRRERENGGFDLWSNRFYKRGGGCGLISWAWCCGSGIGLGFVCLSFGFGYFFVCKYFSPRTFYVFSDFPGTKPVIIPNFIKRTFLAMLE